jgi:hypothetical protein
MFRSEKTLMGPDHLPEFALDASGEVGRRFAALGITSYRDAARHVLGLPYARNSDRSDWRLVLEERCGTCSTKHALLAELARENDCPVSLVLGIYEMDEINTPGVGPVLQRYGLRCVPEAHCRLVYKGTRVDLTSDVMGEQPIEELLYEEEIMPQQIGRYKMDKHHAFVRRWAAERALGFEHIWRVREVCIAALTDRSKTGVARVETL